VPWPRVGVRLHLPRAVERATWFGRGPGEAYPDTGLAAQVSLYTASIEGLQTPYVMPQENGHRADVRWLELTGAPGSTPGLRVEGAPTTGFTARRWTTEQLEAARHDAELVAGPDVVVTLDAALHGTGTASCGPGVLPGYELAAAPRSFSVVLRELPA
jgi:beta-galactosidase